MGRRAYDSWRQLCGIICTYKPPGATYYYVLSKLKSNICKGLNSLETRPPRKCIAVDRSGGEITMNIRPSYADNVLCAGPRYQPEQVKLSILTPLDQLSSGVLAVCINDKKNLQSTLRKLNFTRCYHLKGILGLVTENFHSSGKVLARASYDNVRRNQFEAILGSYESTLQARVFEDYGLPMHSQEAYNFAIKGLYRPTWKNPTIVYSIKLVDFEPPNFTLEVQCINENDNYLKNLIHNLGVSLKCYAICNGIRCLRQGCFHIDDALPKNQWNLDYIIDNIKLMWKVIERNYPEKFEYSSEVTTCKSQESAIQSRTPADEG